MGVEGERFSMIRSIELENLILQWYRDLSAGNTDTTNHLFSAKQSGFLAIGTDPNDWWHDPEIIKNRYQAITSSGGFKVTVDHLEAYSEGNIGWVVSRVEYRLPNGTKLPIRQSFILHQEDGE